MKSKELFKNMQNYKQNWVDMALLFFVVGIFLFLFAANVLLLYQQSEIRAAYAIMLERKPAKEEIALWIGKNADRSEVEDSLSSSEERKKIMENIFHDALGRNISTEERELYKKDAFQSVADQIYRSKERMDVLTSVYVEMLGRPTNKNELFFHVKSRTPLDALRTALNNSQERREAIQKTFEEIIRRAPTVRELETAIQNATPIVEIRVKLENQ